MMAEKNQSKDKFKVLGLIIYALFHGRQWGQASMFEAVQSLWTMSTEVKLEKGQRILQLALKLERIVDGTLEIHQESFVKLIS